MIITLSANGKVEHILTILNIVKYGKVEHILTTRSTDHKRELGGSLCTFS